MDNLFIKINLKKGHINIVESQTDPPYHPNFELLHMYPPQNGAHTVIKNGRQNVFIFYENKRSKDQLT